MRRVLSKRRVSTKRNVQKEETNSGGNLPNDEVQRHLQRHFGNAIHPLPHVKEGKDVPKQHNKRVHL